MLPKTSDSGNELMLRLRPHTVDRAIYRDILELNNYRLPNEFEASDIIIDIGAHIGIFTYACILRGAETISAYEPEPQNFALAKQNLASFLGTKVELYNSAVWRSDVDSRVLFHSGYEYESSGCNTGGGSVFVAEGIPVNAISFDQIMDNLNGPVRFLKLDCEGSEFPILFTSKCLDRVTEIAGEFHELGGPQNADAPVPSFARVSGFDFTKQTLQAVLEHYGFSVETTVDAYNPAHGMFFAHRSTQ